MNTTTKTIEALQDLLTRSCDAEEGFQHAADAVAHEGLAALFHEYADQRCSFREALSAQSKVLGGEPEESGSLMGKVHQFWIDLRGKLSGGREDEILEECLRGEETTSADYQAYASDSEIHPDTRSVINQQLEQITTIYKRLKALDIAAEQMHAESQAAGVSA